MTLIKKLVCLAMVSLMVLLSVSSLAELEFDADDLIPAATRARTTLLDLRTTNTATSSTAEGWAFEPTGDNGHKKLTLNGYGLQSSHSAPIILAPDTLIEVNGVCYIDNSRMNADYDVISAECGGYLHISGSGTLNLYSENYLGSSISKLNGSASDHNDDLVIEGVTVNCYNHERDSHTAFDNQPCIYAYKSMTIRNAVINTYQGKAGLRIWGETPIGGVTEETADEILIENSTVNIQNESENGLWQYGNGIDNTFGRTRITGNSHVTINAGSKSIYTYLSLVIEGGTLDVCSTPVASNTDVWALVTCNCLKIGPDAERVKLSAARYPLTVVLHCKENFRSTLGDGLTVEIGSFDPSEGYATELDPATGLPTLLVTSGSGSKLLGDVDLNGFVEFADVTLLSAYILNEVDLCEQSLINADANEDGTINSLDLTAICNIILNH